MISVGTSEGEDRITMWSADEDKEDRAYPWNINMQRCSRPAARKIKERWEDLKARERGEVSYCHFT